MPRNIFCGLLVALTVCGSVSAQEEKDVNVVPHEQLKIIGATYGAPGKMVDVTKQLHARIQDNQLTVTASTDLPGDPAPRAEKVLRIAYEQGTHTRFISVEDGDQITLPVDKSQVRRRRPKIGAASAPLSKEDRERVMSETAERVLREMIVIPLNEFWTEQDVRDASQIINKVAHHYAAQA